MTTVKVRSSALLCAAWSCWPVLALAQGGRAAPGTLAHSSGRFPCGAGAQLSLSAPTAVQGSVVAVRLTASRPVSGVKAKWDGRQVPFWPEHAGGPAAKVWHGLLGVDLERAPGLYELELSSSDSDGAALGCKAALRVSKGIFPIEKLKVENQFVEPNPDQADRARAEGEKIGRIYTTVTPERLWAGAFRLPLDGVTTGGNFGRRRVLNGQPRSPHTGVDFPSPSGTPVHAAQAGRVVLAEPLFFPGNTVIVDHGLGLYTFYAHLSAFSVKAGDAVERGTVLGQVGATGRVTGPHLHWGVMLDQERVNGMDLVKVLDRTESKAERAP